MPCGLLEGLRQGLRPGLKEGLTGGTLVDPTTGGSVDPMSTVDRDATSGIYCPSTVTQWNTVLSVAGVSVSAPIAIWLCQEAAGNLADSVGGATLTANASPTYSNAVSGWTRVAVGTTDGTANQRFASTAFGLPDLSTTSGMFLGYIQVTGTPAGVRGVSDMGTTVTELRVTTTPSVRLISGANTGNGASNIGTAVRPWVNRFDRTNSVNTLYTDQEKVTPTFGSTVAGKGIRIGATGGAAPSSARYLYACLFSGASAEISDAQVKAILQVLGWTIPWS